MKQQKKYMSNSCQESKSHKRSHKQSQISIHRAFIRRQFISISSYDGHSKRSHQSLNASSYVYLWITIIVVWRAKILKNLGANENQLHSIIL